MFVTYITYGHVWQSSMGNVGGGGSGPAPPYLFNVGKFRALNSTSSRSCTRYVFSTFICTLKDFLP